MSRLRHAADAYAEAVLVAMPDRWRRWLFNVAAVLGVAGALVSVNAMGTLMGDRDIASSADEPMLFADGSLRLPDGLPTERGAAGRADADGGAGTTSQASGDADGDSRGQPSTDVGQVIDVDVAPGRSTPASPRDPAQAAVPLLPAPAAAATPAAIPAASIAAAAPSLSAERGSSGTPAPPATPPAAPRQPLRLELRSLERVTGRNSDRLDVTLVAVDDNAANPHEHVVTMRVALPESAARADNESLRLELAMLPDTADDAADDDLSLRVRVSLSDATIDEPTLARTDAADGTASDTLHLWVPLDPPAGGVQPGPEIPPPATTPPEEAPAPPSTDTTVPVDVLVPVAPETAPAPQTVTLTPSEGNETGAPPAEVTVDVDAAPPAEEPPAPPAEEPPAPAPGR